MKTCWCIRQCSVPPTFFDSLESRLFLSRMGIATSRRGKGEDLDILSASSLARKISNQDFMCRAHFPFGIFFRRSGFCLNNNFPLLVSTRKQDTGFCMWTQFQVMRVCLYYCARFGFVVILLSFRQLDCYRLQIQVKKRQKMAKIAYFFKKKY